MSSMNIETSTLPELLTLRSQIDAAISAACGGDSAAGAVIEAPSGKGKGAKKPSARAGKPTAYGAFSSKIQKEKAEEIKAFKEANPEMKGAHMAWVGKYKEEHPDIYEAFKTEWTAANPKAEAPTSEAASADEGGGAPVVAEKPKKVLSPEHLAAMKAGREAKKAAKDAEKAATEAEAKGESPIALSPSAPAEEAAVAPAKAKKPKQAKKAEAAPITEVAVAAPVAAPVALTEAREGEPLPFKLGGATYIRMGISKADGNHEWASTDLWHSKKGKRASYAGELMEDGSINEDAEEPALV